MADGSVLDEIGRSLTVSLAELKRITNSTYRLTQSYIVCQGLINNLPDWLLLPLSDGRVVEFGVRKPCFQSHCASWQVCVVPVTLLVAGTMCILVMVISVMVISPVNDACNDFSTLAEMTRLSCQCFLPDATRCAETRLPYQSG